MWRHKCCCSVSCTLCIDLCVGQTPEAIHRSRNPSSFGLLQCGTRWFGNMRVGWAADLPAVAEIKSGPSSLRVLPSLRHCDLTSLVRAVRTQKLMDAAFEALWKLCPPLAGGSSDGEGKGDAKGDGKAGGLASVRCVSARLCLSERVVA